MGKGKRKKKATESQYNHSISGIRNTQQLEKLLELKTGLDVWDLLRSLRLKIENSCVETLATQIRYVATTATQNAFLFSDFARSKNSYATLRDPEMIRCNLHGAKNECCDHCDPSRVCWNHCDSKCVFCDFARSKNSYATLRDPEMIRWDFALPKKGMLRPLISKSGMLRPL